MHPQKPDQPDQQQDRSATPRHALLHSGPQQAAEAPAHMLAPDRERLAAWPAGAKDGPWRPQARRASRRRAEPAAAADEAPGDAGQAPGIPAAAPPRASPAELKPAELNPAEPDPPDSGAARLRDQLERVRLHAQHAASWLETSSHYARLVNRDGVVPVTARFSAGDLAFLAEAREQTLGFAELGLRLTELHKPLDACGVSSDPSAPILRCRSCMWRWPCPTFRTLAEVLDDIRHG
jgi:hypothetical protein